MTKLDTLALKACGRSLSELATRLHDNLPPDAARIREDLRETRAVVSGLFADGEVAPRAFDVIAGKAARVGAAFDLAQVLGHLAPTAAEQGRRLADSIFEDVKAVASLPR